MAKQPQFRPQIDPSGNGPLMVEPSNTDAPGRALAGAGRAVARLGSFFSAEAKEAEARTKRLQQATAVSKFGMDAVGDYNRLKDELATVQDPEARYPRYQATQEAIRARLAAIEDTDVRAQAETWLNEESKIWDADIRTGTQSLRVKQADDHLEALGADALRRRDISQVQGYAEHLAAAGFISGQQQADLVGRYEAEIGAELAKDEITAATLSQATHAEQVRYLKSLERPAEMNEQQWAEFRDGLYAKLDVERAAAAQEERLAARVVEQNDRKLLADAWQGSLDVAGALQMMEDGSASAAAVNQAMTMAKDGPRAENEPETFMAAERWLSRVRAQPARKEEALTWLRANAAQLTATTWQGYVSSIEKAGDPADLAGSPSAKLFEGLIEEHFRDLGTFGDPDTPEAERKFIDVKLRWHGYLEKNPDATDEEMQQAYRQLIWRPAQISIKRRIWDAIVGGATGSTALRNLRNMPAGPPEGPLFAAPAGPEDEPGTQAEFEERVKAFVPGSKEQVQYYRRWAGKWQ